MDNGRKPVTCALARELDMVGYLADLGIEPAKIKGDNYWYHSPFRHERTPSFKINRRLNRYYDFGEGEGGSLIDFGVRWHSCTVGEFLRILDGDLPATRDFKEPPLATASPCESKLTIQKVRSIFYSTLLDYLNERRIPFDLADRYCKQVDYRIAAKTYFAIGFENDRGGYELRSRYFKGSSSPKAVTTFRGHSDTLCVLEGFMDFLSFLVVQEKCLDKTKYDFLILNSIAHFSKARPIMEEYKRIWLYLDNDAPGKNLVASQDLSGSKYQDKSGYFRGHKDLNELLCHSGNTPDFYTELLPP